jgi:glycosyltransferase involved in cell wall biosynthesis
MNKIKISMLTTWNILCGIAEYSKFLNNELSKFKYLEIRVSPIKKPNSINPFYFIKLLRETRGSQIVHIQYQPGIFGHMPIPHFSFSYFPLLISILRLWRKNRTVNNIVVTLHEINLNSRMDRLILKFLESSNKLIVHTEKLKELLIKNGISGEKITIIPLGTLRGEQMDKEECKRRLGVEDKKVITIFGFVHENKGHDLVIDILPKLSREVILFVAGGPRIKEHENYYNSLKEKASFLGVSDRVKFLNFIKEENLPVILNATDIAIFPYRWIVASGALHLALGYRIPVLVSNLNYFKEIKNKYDCIELFENNNKQDLYEKIQKLLNDKNKREYLKSKSEEFYEKTNWKIVAEEHRNLYLELICGHPDEMYKERRQKERIDWLKNNKEGTAVEIGCATGFVTNYVEADIGIDLREDRVLLASIKYPHIKFIKCDASQLPFSNNSYDTVLVPDILEHVPFQIAQNILKEAYRVCKVQVLLTLPNASKEGWSEDSEIGGKNPEHLWAPTKEKVNELLKEYNYEARLSNEEIFY